MSWITYYQPFEALQVAANEEGYRVLIAQHYYHAARDFVGNDVPLVGPLVSERTKVRVKDVERKDRQHIWLQVDSEPLRSALASRQHTH